MHQHDQVLPAETRGPDGEAGSPTLSVVIPVKNEPVWIERCIRGIAQSIVESDWRQPEIIVVDDGSTDGTPQVLDALGRDGGLPVPLRICHQQNTGRLVARLNGIKMARSDFVMMLDSRLLMSSADVRAALDGVRRGRIAQVPDCQVNAVTVYARFWDALPRIFWSRYMHRPRDLSFGIEDYDLYPKGTGGCLAPRSVLLEAYAQFSTRFADLREANDDTTLLRYIAERYRIWISPSYTCLYEARGNLRSFIPHAMHRGMHFVDGFFRRDSPFAPILVAFYPISLGVAVATLTGRPLAAPLALGTFSALLTGAGAWRRLPPAHLVALAVVTPVFTLAYGIGLWRGMGLVVSTKLCGGTTPLNVEAEP